MLQEALCIFACTPILGMRYETRSKYLTSGITRSIKALPISSGSERIGSNSTGVGDRHGGTSYSECKIKD